jgi:hemerythrin-like domain-containing protein
MLLSLTARLTADHEEFRNLGRAIEAIMRTPPAGQDSARLVSLVAEFQQKLTRHAQLEDGEFYPAIRKVMLRSSFLNKTYMDHLDQEHIAIEGHLNRLVEQVSAAPPAFGWGQTFAIFSVGLRSHMRREEEELFPEADRLLGQEKPF